MVCVPILILLAEALGADPFRDRIKIYATDVDEEALNRARHASYGAKDLEPVPPELREKYFVSASNRSVFRSLLSLDLGLPVEKMKVGIRACLIGESDHEEVALDAVNRRGKSIKCRVTCTPIVGASKERHGAILMMEEQE